ncbi:MAG: PilZ domain-containing protein [Proteobacteria bacterium]|nr:PilZ domain-containing protein [Pseudomonadota bacterium]MDA1301837.1 PilZ domain-containing protein [Pseudomonadota bacterium]
MKWGIRYVRSQVNRRQHTRIIAKLEARFDCERGGAEAEVFDLSLGGCGLPTDFQLHPGDLLRLDLRSDGWQLQELNGVVRWTAFSFAGVEFKALDTDDRKTLRSLVELHFHDDTPICDGASNSPSS